MRLVLLKGDGGDVLRLDLKRSAESVYTTWSLWSQIFSGKVALQVTARQYIQLSFRLHRV
jgi:hypothetical protein